jgi:hypothetical protein
MVRSSDLVLGSLGDSALLVHQLQETKTSWPMEEYNELAVSAERQNVQCIPE